MSPEALRVMCSMVSCTHMSIAISHFFCCCCCCCFVLVERVLSFVMLQETELSREFAKVNVTHLSGAVTPFSNSLCHISLKIEFNVIAINSYFWKLLVFLRIAI